MKYNTISWHDLKRAELRNIVSCLYWKKEGHITKKDRNVKSERQRTRSPCQAELHEKQRVTEAQFG